MIYVTIHAAWMILAVALGTVAGYMGLLRATQGQGGRSLLPGRFHLRSHSNFGVVYYAMLYLGILFGWVVHDYLLDAPVLPPAVLRWHLALAGAVAVLYGIAWVLGAQMTREPAGARRLRPRLHMVFNFTACTLVAVQVALAAYYVWIRPATR
jgi:hypothetical protein